MASTSIVNIVVAIVIIVIIITMIIIMIVVMTICLNLNNKWYSTTYNLKTKVDKQIQ